MKIAATLNRRELRDENTTINNVNEPIAIQNKSIASAYSQKNARAYNVHTRYSSTYFPNLLHLIIWWICQ